MVCINEQSFLADKQLANDPYEYKCHISQNILVHNLILYEIRSYKDIIMSDVIFDMNAKHSFINDTSNRHGLVQ